MHACRGPSIPDGARANAEAPGFLHKPSVARRQSHAGRTVPPAAALAAACSDAARPPNRKLRTKDKERVCERRIRPERVPRVTRFETPRSQLVTRLQLSPDILRRGRFGAMLRA